MAEKPRDYKRPIIYSCFESNTTNARKQVKTTTFFSAGCWRTEPDYGGAIIFALFAFHRWIATFDEVYDRFYHLLVTLTMKAASRSGGGSLNFFA